MQRKGREIFLILRFHKYAAEQVCTSPGAAYMNDKTKTIIP